MGSFCGAKSQTVQTNQSQNYTPDPYARGAIQGALGTAQNVAQTPFSTPQAPVAGFSPDQLRAFQLTGQVPGMAQPYFDQAQGYLTGQRTGDFFNPYAANVTAGLEDIFGKQMSQTTGQLTQAAGGVGADRIAVGQSELARQQSLGAGQTLANLYAPALQAAQTAGFGLANFGPASQNAALQGAQALLGTGGLQQQLAQAQANAPYQQELARINWPYMNSQFLTGSVGALAPGLGGTTQGQGQTIYPPGNPWGSIIGAGTALAGGLGSFGGGGGPGSYGLALNTGNTGLGGGGPGVFNGSFGWGNRGGAAEAINPYAAGSDWREDQAARERENWRAHTERWDKRFAKYARGGDVSDEPIDIEPNEIIPHQQIAPIRPNIPQLNLSAPAPSQQKGGGGLGDLISIGSKVLPFFLADGGRAMNPYAAGGVTNFDDRYSAMSDATPAELPETYMPPAAWNATRRAPPDAGFGGEDDSTLPPTASPDAAVTAGPNPTLNPYTAQPTPSPRGGFMSSPWAGLLSAGLGMMAASGQRDAHGLPISPMAAIGQGGLQGLKTLETQRAADQKQQSIDQAAAKLQQAVEFHRDQYTKMTPYQQELINTQKQRFGQGLFDAETVNMMAEQALAGDKSVFANLGRGVSGAQNIWQVRQRMNELMRQRGYSGSDVAAKNAEFLSQTAAAKSAAVREANVAANVEEAKKTFPLAIEASKALPRSSFTPWNEIVQKVQQKTASPAQARFEVAVQGAITAYAQAMARNGTSTVDSRQHAELLLNKATSHEAFAAAIDQMQLEMAAAEAAPDAVRKRILSHISGRPEGAPPPPTPGAGGAPGFTGRTATNPDTGKKLRETTDGNWVE